ncbi:UDP-N-acetylmuramate dehydrogenase [Pseudomonas sp. NY15372]|uniref:UDP-N-acetylmuramate dehydrogenase n=1 Tax=Pseudomonas sp. NY15372 TaxID=3400356 RepID=UPI003A8B4CAD
MNGESFGLGFEQLHDFLQAQAIPFKRDFILKYETYFKRGGVAAFYVAPSSIEQLKTLLKFFKKNDVKWKLIGLSTNVIFFDDLSYGVIVTVKNLTGIFVNGCTFDLECGYSLQDFVRVALINGKGGVEGLEGVPGTLGGAIFMNAGAYGYTISDRLVTVDVITPEGEMVTLTKEECDFNNRSSFFKKHPDHIIASAKFELVPVDHLVSAKKIETYHIARHSYQEFAYPNLGSMFSVRGDFYKEFFNGSRLFYLLCVAFKLVLKNPISKFIQRKRPHNKVFNNLAIPFLGNEYPAYTPSVKSMNILINDGTTTTEDILCYIALVRKHLNPSTPIENEIIKSPVNQTTDSAKKIFTSIAEKGL